MSKIKVGQVYELPFTRSNVVVTYIEHKEDSAFDWIYLLTIEGQDRLWRKTVETLKLVAEYPTWQEAVNSKEFNNE